MNANSRIRDLFADVSIELRSQPAKTALLISAVVLSIGALLASVGISKNAAHQIDADLAASTLRLVTVQVAEAHQAQASEDNAMSMGDSGQDSFFPSDTQERLESIELIESAGMTLNLNDVVSTVVTRPSVGMISAEDAPDAQGVHGATSGYLAALDIELESGDPSLLDSDLAVAYLGSRAAEQLGIPVTRDMTGRSISINSEEYSVAGILPEGTPFDRSVIIPMKRATEIAGDNVTATVLIKTRIGAGNPVSRIAREAILPEAPTKLDVSNVISAEGARDNVATQMARQATWVGIFLVVLTTLLIANSMIVAVTARTTEIGVRRALGSSKAEVASVFWFEGGLVGFLGGIGGSALAAWVIVAVAVASGWSAQIDPAWIAVGPLLGTAVGLLASAYPALRASHIHPAIAVRAN